MPDYILTLRPASIGCYPDRDNAGHPLTATIVESHWPPKRVDNRNLYAVVAYVEPLEFDRIWRYDLLPADKLEEARYGFWLEAGRSWDDADTDARQWCELPRAELEAMRERDRRAEWALTILDAEALTCQ
jgi:hypothetical protein